MELPKSYELGRPTRFQRARGAVVCWLVLFRAKLVGGHRNDPQVEQCLQLKKGTRFRLNGGQVELVEENELASVQTGVE